MDSLIHRPVIAGVVLAAVIAAVGVVASVSAELTARDQAEAGDELVDRLALARHVDELATSVLNLAPELRDEDPIDEIAEDIDDERELAEQRLATATIDAGIRSRLQALLDEAQSHVDAERFALDPEVAIDLSSRLRAEATAAIGDAPGVTFPDVGTTSVVALRVEAAALMPHVAIAMATDGDVPADLIDVFERRLDDVATSQSAALFDPEVELTLDEPGADIDTLDQLSEIVVTMTMGIERRASDTDFVTDRGAVFAYAAAFVIASTSLGGLLVAERVARRRELEQLRVAAGHDELTGAANRSQLRDAYKAMRPGRTRPLGVVYIDLDHFKPINDSFGHHVGDEVLRIVAKRIKESVRAGDTVARMGGDEFVALISGPRDENEILAVAERLVSRLNESVTVDGQKIDIGASGGAAIVTSRAVELAEALRRADAALFAAKKAGRGQLLTSAALDPTGRTPVAAASD
ncbi:MAG: hypothetical protein DHS20C19_10010 [Acidimicrobiales bacterium]|nr:MAG: hypothetical protein DHS20C19_10010 [Acidimicrobiales bacterium]